MTELVRVPTNEVLVAIVRVGVTDRLEEPINGLWEGIGTVETLDENIRGVTACVLVVRVIGAVTDRVTGALIFDVVVIMLGDVIKGVMMVTGSEVVGVEVTATVDDSLLVTTTGELLLVSPELGILIASIQLCLVSKAIFESIIAT